MKLARSLPLLLAPLSALALALQGGQEGAKDPQTADRPPQEAGEESADERVREGIRETRSEDELPEGVGNRNVGELDIFGRPKRPTRDSLVDRIKGGWRLKDMELKNSNSNGRVQDGFLHIGENFMSLEVHANWEGVESSRLEYDLHVCYTAEYTIDATGRMFTLSTIGSYLQEYTGTLQWERRGFAREYFVRENGGELVLEFDKGQSRMVFQPVRPSLLARRDIFGRKTIVDPEDNSIGTDIFGRKAQDTTGARDIFGRIVPDPEEEDEDGKAGDGASDTDPGGRSRDGR
ncbi:MAG: hypothetical protein AAGB93_02500 [Planctomycetota bacterium]